MSVVREEIFGPVVVAQRFEGPTDDGAHGQRHLLWPGRGIWTRTWQRCPQLATDPSGTVLGQLPRHDRYRAAVWRLQGSGLGREQGRQGVEAYLETKTVIIQL
jgi:phenylacetaldehyde dehydrogenase